MQMRRRVDARMKDDVWRGERTDAVERSGRGRDFY
jgi:hypothetical protein